MSLSKAEFDRRNHFDSTSSEGDRARGGGLGRSPPTERQKRNNKKRNSPPRDRYEDEYDHGRQGGDGYYERDSFDGKQTQEGDTKHDYEENKG